MPYHIIEQTIDRITVHNLKHIRDLDIDFSGNRVTGIFGMNGCGKSSILHALACFYRSLNNGSERNYFTRFFKRVGNDAWKDSKITASFTITGNSKTVVFKKGDDRWIPRIDSKPQRDSFFVGIDSCVPAIEKEPLTRTSFHMTNRGSIDNHDAVVQAFSNIMCRTYDAVQNEAFLKKMNRLKLIKENIEKFWSHISNENFLNFSAVSKDNFKVIMDLFGDVIQVAEYVPVSRKDV